MLNNKSAGFTVVSNVFIEKYMPKARGKFIKVYLTLLRYNNSGEPGINSEILAANLDLLESDIMNALYYWNDAGVINLKEFDNRGNFKIEFLDLSEKDVPENSQVDFLNALDKNDTKDMLKDLEKALGRSLSPNEMIRYLNWQKEFGFSSEVILLLIEYCALKGKTDSRYIERVAINWHDKKITTVEQAQKLITDSENRWLDMKKILSYLGIQNTDIMKPQQNMLEKWLITFNFSLEMIYKACDICFERLNHADFKYIDGILTNWYKDNIKTLQDVATCDKKPKNFQSGKNSYTSQKKSGDRDNFTPKRFNNFKPRDYDYEDLEKKLLGWDDDND